LQHEFQTGKDLGSDSWYDVHGHQSYHDKQQTSASSDSLNLVQETHNINNHVEGNNRAEIAQNNSLLHSVISRVPQIMHNKSHIPVTEVEDAIRQRQYSDLDNSNAAINLIPGWLRSDPSFQQLLRRNISGSDFEHKFLEELWTTAKLVRKPLKPVKEPLLTSGHKPSGSFEFDVQHSVDKYGRIVLSVVDSGFTDFAINFQRLSVDAVGLQNFLFVCTDEQAVTILEQHGIACSHYRGSTAVQVIKTNCASCSTLCLVHTALSCPC